MSLPSRSFRILSRSFFSFRTRTRRTAFALLVLLLATLPSAAQVNPARLKGTLLMEDGSALGVKIKLTFTPDASAARAARKLKVSKDGHFSSAFFPSGRYTVSLDNEEFWIKSMEFSADTPSGQNTAHFEGAAHPEEGLPPIQITGGMHHTLNLVAASVAEREKYVQQIAIVEAKGELKTVSELFAANDMEGVLRETEQLLDKNPDLGPAVYLRGVALGRMGKLVEAERFLRRAWDLIPEQPGIQQALASVLLNRAKELDAQGKSEDAGEFFGKSADAFRLALKETPGNIPLLTNCAVALSHAGRSKEAIEVLETLVASDPGQTAAWFKLASLYSAEGNAEAAIRTLGKIPGKGRDAAARIYNVAIELYNSGDFDTALVALDQAEAADPDLHLVHHLRGMILLATGKSTEALPFFERFVSLNPDHADAAADRKIIEALRKTTK